MSSDEPVIRYDYRATSIVRFVVLMPLLLIATVPMWIVHRLFLLSSSPRFYGTVPMLWQRMALVVLGIRMTASGTKSPRRPLLIVANHVSWSDISVLGAAADGSFVAKADMASWPGLSIFARITRTIFVDRGARGTTGQQAEEIGQRLASGEPILLFPEGTTYDGSGVGPFKSALLGAVRIALEQTGESEMAIQPVAIAYTHRDGRPLDDETRREHVAWIGALPFGPHAWSIVSGPRLRARVVFGEPIVVSEQTDRKALTRQLQERIAAMLDEAYAAAR